MQKIIRLPLWSVAKSKPAPSATSSPYSHAGFLVSHVHYSERIKTLYGSVLGGERMTVLTGGTCQLTGLPELAIHILPTGPGSAVRSALRTAPQRQFAKGPAAASLSLRERFAITNWPRPGRRHSAVDPAHAPMRQAMSVNLKIPDIRELKPRITVFGVGGAGGNAVNNMINAGLQGVDFVIANTDAQALAKSRAEGIIQMGVQVTEGLGAGSKPDVGLAAAEEVIDEIRDHLTGAHMVFVTAGMGGGTGTGASPVVARAARELGILTVGVVTKPFHFEGQRRMRLAESGIMELQKSVDTLIIIPNQNLFRVANEKTTVPDAFAMADQVLYSGVACISDLVVKEGLINLDFADVRAVMREMGKAMMGTGEASGDKRALRSAEAAISNPLMDDVSLRGARGLLISITGGKDLTLYEVDEAATRIREEVDADANIIVGATFEESLDGIIRVSVVATGVDINAADNVRPSMLSHRPAAA
jgi:cell division protein FtsZ